MASGDDDYATPDRLAIYLEIGWSDYLYGTKPGSRSGDEPGYPNPRQDRVPPTFPVAAINLAKQWAQTLSLDPRSVCDVGGATGRALFEFDRQFPSLERLVLVEPSKRFCEWARRLLASDEALPEVPLADRIGTPKWVSPKARPRPIEGAPERVSIVNAPLELYTPDRGFDLVSCFNVIDRHPRPSELVKTLGGLLSDGGLLVLSSPFDFRAASTPDPASWIDDLNALFADTDSWSYVGEDELYYEYRLHDRSWTRLCAQVVAKHRRV